MSGASQNQSPLDPNKPTVCTITVNSDEEKEVFKTHMGAKFNFIELADYKNPRWLEDACLREVQCDVLQISGHFGGMFFGRTKVKLPLSTMNLASCRKDCAGIFKRPKEVYLFGCNTTSGDQKRTRTPEEHSRVLLEEHPDIYTSLEMAQMHTALLFSPLGGTTADKMRRIFPNSKIYGWYDSAPTGVNIGPRLRRYFGSLGDYLTHFSSMSKGKRNRKWEKAMKGQYIATIEGVGEGVENPLCILEGEGPIRKKLEWVNRTLSDPNKMMTYLPTINEYFQKLEKRFGTRWDDWHPDYLPYLEIIQNNSEAKDKLEQFFAKTELSWVSIQVEALNFGGRVGWFSDNEISQIKERLIGDMFSQNFDRQKADMVCSLRINLGLTLSEIPPRPWAKETFRAVGCTRPVDPGVQSIYVQALSHENQSLAEEAAHWLKFIGPTNERIIQSLFDRLTTEGRLAAQVLRTLPLDKPWQLDRLKTNLDSGDQLLQAMTHMILDGSGLADVEIQNILAKQMLDKTWPKDIRYGAVKALSTYSLQDRKLQLMFIDALADPDTSIGYLAADKLGDLQVGGSDVDARFLVLLKVEDANTLYFVIEAMGRLKNFGSGPILRLRGLTRHPTPFVKEAAVKALLAIEEGE